MDIVLGRPTGTLSGSESCPCTKTAAAVGTEWEAGPGTLDDNNATDTLDITTAPSGSVVIYADDDDADEAGLAFIPVGSGSIVYFGWDWFFSSSGPKQFADCSASSRRRCSRLHPGHSGRTPLKTVSLRTDRHGATLHRLTRSANP